MDIRNRFAGIAGFALLLSATSAAAHHSFAMFDQNTTSEITGVVSKFIWTNPHVMFVVEAPGSNGTTERYAIEAASTNMLARKGWKVSSLKAGDRIQVTFHPLRNQKKGGLLVEVQKANGEVLTQ